MPCWLDPIVPLFPWWVLYVVVYRLATPLCRWNFCYWRQHRLRINSRRSLVSPVSMNFQYVQPRGVSVVVVVVVVVVCFRWYSLWGSGRGTYFAQPLC